ncbi:MAG: ATP-binding protein [Halarcobacter sp.]
MNCKILKELISYYGKETEWMEFKVNNEKPKMIGQYISSLANSAMLHDMKKAYLIFGVDDESLEIIGTKVNLKLQKTGNEELENWLHRLLEPKIDFNFIDFDCEGLNVSVIEIDCAQREPVKFEGTEYIRVGSYKKKLHDYPEKERKLWQKFSTYCFEEDIALKHATNTQIFDLLDYENFFKLMNIPYNETINDDNYILEKLKEHNLIKENFDFLDITNLGALLFARKILDFHSLSRKPIRMIKYKGTSKIQTEFEIEGQKGYASGFKGLIKYIMDKLPRNEVIKDAIRKDVPLYPEIAIRELIANALIHQDLTISGVNPMIEIYDNRIEISNSGKPLIDIKRLIDYQPKSRNEKLSYLMRMMGICEERGSGIDKVIEYIELYQLPAPKFIEESDFFKVVLFAPLEFEDMDRKDRIRAAYQHCCLQYMKQEYMTNSTLRKRFGMKDGQHSKVSKIIKDAIEEGFIKPADPSNKSTKHIKYVPYYTRD